MNPISTFTSALTARLSHSIPAVGWLASYRLSWLRADVIAGITLAAYLLPASLGDASLARLPAEAGLYACMFSGLVFWLFCSSRHTTITVTSAISLLIGSTLGTISGGDPTRFAALAAGTAILVGLIAIAAWLFKAGSIINFISESVMIGFKCGVALYLASTQLPKLLGLHGAHGTFWQNRGTFVRHLDETNLAALAIGGTALAVLILGKIFLKNIPMGLVVVVGSVVASRVLGLDERGVKLLGEVPQGLPAIGLPAVHWADLQSLLPLAVACFLLASVETSAIGRTFAARYGRRLDPNQEFLALGVSNLVSGLGQGYPISGGMSQSLVNESGGRERHCPAPSRREPFWWWCSSSRICSPRCPSPCWRRSSWSRWWGFSVCRPSSISGAAIVVNSPSPWWPCSAC